MRRRNALLGLFIAICIIFAGTSMVIAKSSSLQQSGGNTIKTIAKTTIYLEKKTSSSLYYRVTVTSASGISSSITATITLQRSESGKWVDKTTVNKTVNNANKLDEVGTISVSSYGSGNYRIMGYFSDVCNGITNKVGPMYSDTVPI